jgi:UDP-N-acetylmuramoyl-tripeptide--D-alanyl-D-alanine ligase
MIAKTLKWAADVLGSKCTVQDENTDQSALSFQGAVIDSRLVKPGMLYVPIVGARADGHDFIESVKENGAAAVLWQKDHLPVPEGIPSIVVESTHDALGALAKAYLAEIKPLTIGVTGSNGKTSTKDMLASILSRKYKTTKTEKNRNSDFGLPLTVFDMDLDTEGAVLEMGLEFPGDISYLCSLAPLDGAIITSIGSAHMENFGNKSGIAKGKMEILEGLKPDGIFVYNRDAKEITDLFAGGKETGFSIYTYSSNPKSDADFKPEESAQYKLPGMSFSCANLSDEPVYVNALGDYQVQNALAAADMAKKLGIAEEDILKGLEEVNLTAMRGSLHKVKNGWVLDDTYKSNPEAAAQALQTLVSLPAGIHAAILADMLDLGEHSDELHENTGKLAKELGVDVLITYGESSRHTAKGFGENAIVAESKERAAKLAEELLEKDAAVLIKGSRAMAMNEIVDMLLEENS